MADNLTPLCGPGEQANKKALVGHVFSYTHRIASVASGTNACVNCGLTSGAQPDRQQGGAIPLGLM